MPTIMCSQERSFITGRIAKLLWKTVWQLRKFVCCENKMGNVCYRFCLVIVCRFTDCNKTSTVVRDIAGEGLTGEEEYWKIYPFCSISKQT